MEIKPTRIVKDTHFYTSTIVGKLNNGIVSEETKGTVQEALGKLTYHELECLLALIVGFIIDNA